MSGEKARPSPTCIQESLPGILARVREIQVFTLKEIPPILTEGHLKRSAPAAGHRRLLVLLLAHPVDRTKLSLTTIRFVPRMPRYVGNVDAYLLGPYNIAFLVSSTLVRTLFVLAV